MKRIFIYIKRSSLACPKSEHQHYVPNDRNPNKVLPNPILFGFRRRLKSERSDFGRWLYIHWGLYFIQSESSDFGGCQNPNFLGFRFQTEHVWKWDGTKWFGFWTIWNPSDPTWDTKLDHFICNFFNIYNSLGYFFVQNLDHFVPFSDASFCLKSKPFHCFQTLSENELFDNRTIMLCPKSQNVHISALFCTWNVFFAECSTQWVQGTSTAGCWLLRGQVHGFLQLLLIDHVLKKVNNGQELSKNQKYVSQI